MWKAGNGRTLHTHTYTHFPALCPLNTGVFTFNSKQQQQPAAFPTAPSITRQSLTRVFQWLLCEHWTQKRFPALASSCPRYRWLSGHSDKAWLCITSSHSASLPNSHGKAIRARGRKGWDQGCREPAELRPPALAASCSSTTGFTSQGVKLQHDSDVWGKADPGYVVSRLRLERWSALSLLQIETMM